MQASDKPLQYIEQSKQDEDIRLEDRMLFLYIEWSRETFLPLDRDIKSEEASCAVVERKNIIGKNMFGALRKNLFPNVVETEWERMRRGQKEGGCLSYVTLYTKAKIAKFILRDKRNCWRALSKIIWYELIFQKITLPVE